MKVKIDEFGVTERVRNVTNLRGHERITPLNPPLTFSQQKSASPATALNRFTDELVNFLLLIRPFARSELSMASK